MGAWRECGAGAIWCDMALVMMVWVPAWWLLCKEGGQKLTKGKGHTLNFKRCRFKQYLALWSPHLAWSMLVVVRVLTWAPGRRNNLKALKELFLAS